MICVNGVLVSFAQGTGENVNMSEKENDIKNTNKADELVIVLDPGHDSKHGGASGYGYKEHELNLKITQYCYEELTQYKGVKVFMTRTTNACPNPDAGSSTKDNELRVKYAESVGADVYIAFHLNSNTSSSPFGAEVYYPNKNYKPEYSTEGKELAETILNNLEELGLKKRGVMSKNSSVNRYPDGSVADYYGVIRHSKLNGFPGIIIEHAFLSNSSDVSNFLSKESQLKALGVADAKAIAEYYGLEKGIGFKWTNLSSNSYAIGNNAELYYAVNEPGIVTVQMYYGNNKYMKTLVANKEVGTNDQVVRWDLTDENGNYVDNGTYRFTINVKNKAGESKTVHKWFKVTGNEPLAYKWTTTGVDSFAIGESAPLYYAVNKKATVTINLYYGNNDFMKTLVSNKVVGTNDQVAFWDLTDASGNYVPNGTYRFSITATTANGEKITTHKWFKVTGNEPLKFKWTTTGVNNFSIGEKAPLYYAVNKKASVTINLYYGNNTFMKTLVTNKVVGTNDQVAFWDLKDAKGNYVPNGTYRFSITATNENGEKITTHIWFKVTGN